MSTVIVSLYRALFLRKRFYGFNRMLFRLSLRGMGILNHESDYLSGEKWLIERFCRNKLKTVIDVGANIGEYSELIVRNNEGAKVFSFEPHPVTFKTLRHSAEQHGYSAVNSAVGAAQGSIHIYDHAHLDGSQHASIHRDVIEKIHGSESTAHQVDMTTLDDFMQQRGISKIDLLKVDTEGNEYQVLSGARNALASGEIEVIQFEFNVTNIISKVFMKDFFEILSNYHLFRLLPDGLVLLRDRGLDVADVEIFAFQNIVAIHRTSHHLRSLGIGR